MELKSLKSRRLALLFVASLAPIGHGQGIDFAKISILTEKIAPNFYTLTGSPGADPGHPEAAGGRIGVLVGPDGVFMVDAQYAPVTDKVVAAIRKLSSAPIRFLVDTHEHPDHTGGNPNFAKMGVVIFSREEVREELSKGFPPALAAAIGVAASGTDPARLPVVTYGLGSPVKIRMDGEVIDLIPIQDAHTDGDTIVRFENSDVIMIGDFYRSYGYPFVDPTHGGTFKGVLGAIDDLTKIAGPNTQLVPGHGPIVKRADLVGYRAMIVDVMAQVKQMVDQGKSLQEVLSAKVTAPYDGKVPGGITPLPKGAGGGTTADRFVSLLYAEVKGGK